MPDTQVIIAGLTDAEVLASRAEFGGNALVFKKENAVWNALKSLIKEPMVLLLLVASTIYFISGKYEDGIFLASAIVLVAAISLFQDSRSRNAMEQLKKISQPDCQVIRNGERKSIKKEELVIGDFLVVEEGTAVSADGKIVRSNDFSVNESILTGESMPVSKDPDHEDAFVYQGTTVVSGLAIATLTAIGNGTRLGKIGQSLEDIKPEKTPLELQIGNFVSKMVLIGGVVFVIVWGINYFHTFDLLDSLLKALTLAMSILPEEIPVAFTSFMALGAMRMMKMGVVVKQMKTVETLGSATVICTDKTGTITENRMSLARLYVQADGQITDPEKQVEEAGSALIRMAMWASEPIPFDPMEIALHESYLKHAPKDERPDYQLVHEYPLGGIPPMMTHVFADGKGNCIIAAKGAPEAMMAVSTLSEEEKQKITAAMERLSQEGYRLLGVGDALFEGDNFPATQQEFKFDFKGMVAFYDPPKPNMKQVFEQFYDAGMAVKIVTGDNVLTTTAIARQTGFRGYEHTLSGQELMEMSEPELQEKVETTQVFTRMFPDAKLRIINALKSQNEIVAMTGDGVNDGPALKAAHIGIAMGKRGSELAKEAASLILINDDLANMLDAVAMGRRIYTNLKKAIQYIISIHIPIILTVFIPLALGWRFPNIFSPIHIIFLELIMGPTCSIIYENEPLEKNAMQQKPRPLTNTFFNARELFTSIIQGLVITIGTLFMYQFAVMQGMDEALTRTLVFVALISANILLTLVNRSFYYDIFTTLKFKNNLVPLIIGITVAIVALLLYLPPLTSFFEFETPQVSLVLISVGVGAVSVLWFEIVKAVRRMHNKAPL